MGTRMAPSYANVFMGQLEKSFLDTQHRQPLIWLRYIDDVFMTWTHREQHLSTFVEELNQHHDTIKFTAEWSPKEVTLLDTRISINNGATNRTCQQQTQVTVPPAVPEHSTDLLPDSTGGHLQSNPPQPQQNNQRQT